MFFAFIGTLLTTDDSISFMHGRKQLADSLASKNITIAPGVYDGISAHLVENVGFETGFLSGAGVSNSRLARPDIGFINQTEIAAQTRDITDMVDIPIWVDADTGYGNSVNVYDTVKKLENAGAAAIMIEDQEWPKRCGHMDGKSVVSFDDAVSKIEAAVKARNETDENLLIKARTDAAGTHGIDEAIRRMKAFSDVGADIVFPDAILNKDDISRAANEIEEAHLSVNMGFGIRSRPTTPLIPAKELEDLGVNSVIYPRLITAAATKGMKDALESLETAVETHDEYQEPDKVVSWDYYMDLIGQPEMQRLEQEFAKK